MVRRQGTLEGVVIDVAFWRGRRVFLTGHTGFKGGWMALVMKSLGSEVTGYALAPDDHRGIFSAAGVERDVRHIIGDVRDLSALQHAIEKAQPEIVIHMAAQSLVRRSYASPVETYATNVMGTVNVLEALRGCGTVAAIVIVTSDKCYENVGRAHGYKEDEPLGGSDPYSSSKGCVELVTQAYRRSFFGKRGAVPIASARAGNVIGGGDWAEDRLVPDAMRAFLDRKSLELRNPQSLRPWQHVIDPVLAYMLLAEKLVEGGEEFAEAWNFGPSAGSEILVGQLADMLVRAWGQDASWRRDNEEHPAEAAFLKLDCFKARDRLVWRPLLNTERSVALTVDWYRAFQRKANMRDISRGQIAEVLSETRLDDAEELQNGKGRLLSEPREKRS